VTRQTLIDTAGIEAERLIGEQAPRTGLRGDGRVAFELKS
jgi:hypothetical protein